MIKYLWFGFWGGVVVILFTIAFQSDDFNVNTTDAKIIKELSIDNRQLFDKVRYYERELIKHGYTRGENGLLIEDGLHSMLNEK